MSKMEKEIKILDIDVDETQEKLGKIGATFKSKKDQKIFTYDLMAISFRFDEAICLMKSDNELLKSTALIKLKIVLEEFEDLVDDELLEKCFSEMKIASFEELYENDYSTILSKINSSATLLSEIGKMKINPNKWIRLRKSNDKVELTVKHVLEKNTDKIQKVKEFEITVSDLEETNRILQEVGIVRRNYQEKIRYSYTYKNAEIEIDIWPKLQPYMEVECDDENVIDEIVELLGYSEKKIVSLNTEQLYREIGIDILKMSDLKF